AEPSRAFTACRDAPARCVPVLHGIFRLRRQNRGSIRQERPMGLFSKITDRIFGRKAAATPSPAPSASAKPAPIIFDGSEDQPKVSPPPLQPTPTPAAEPVDVEAVLTAMAEEKGGKSDWR